MVLWLGGIDAGAGRLPLLRETQSSVLNDVMMLPHQATIYSFPDASARSLNVVDRLRAAA